MQTTEYEKIILEKLKQLPPYSWKEVIDFIEFLNSKIEKKRNFIFKRKKFSQRLAST